MSTDQANGRCDWRLPDKLGEPLQPLLTLRKPHPLGCSRARIDDRRAMEAIFFVLPTGCQWNALRDTGLWASSSAHRRFQEWAAAWGSLELEWRPCEHLRGYVWIPETSIEQSQNFAKVRGGELFSSALFDGRDPSDLHLDIMPLSSNSPSLEELTGMLAQRRP